MTSPNLPGNTDDVSAGQSGDHPKWPAHQVIRQLFDDYVRMYSSRDDRLTEFFSENFSGFTGGGKSLVKDTAEWIAITRQDFAQVKDSLRIEIHDVSIQPLAETIAVATGFFRIHLPIKDHILSRETARLVLIFRKESAGWKIAHSSISIPYHLVREGEVYPLKELVDRNQAMESLIAERTGQLSEANAKLQKSNDELAKEIAERTRAENALQISEARYRSILNASPDDITIADMQGRIVMVSSAALPMFGFPSDQQGLGRLVTDFIVPEDRARALAQIALKGQGRGTGLNEYRGLRLDGSSFDIEANSEFIRDAAGVPTGLVLIVRDITARKRAEAEKGKLEILNRQLLKSESLSRMAGAIAHHFNNQLQAVMMSLELVANDLSHHAGSVENLNIAMQSARKAAEVSELMLTYLGQAPGERGAVDLSSVCRKRVPLLRAVLPRGVILDADLASPGPVIHAEANQIQQVLTNLVTNAWEACADGGGTIRLLVNTVSNRVIPAAHRFPLDYQPQESAYACLEVADTGGGIPVQDIERIFDPFFSRKFSGRGLGLAVVQGITRAHDGVVTVESEPGRGSVFRVFLPVSAKAVI